MPELYPGASESRRLSRLNRMECSYKALPWNILFGAGMKERLPAALDELGLSAALVLCTPGQRARAESISELLGERAVGLFSNARMHVPAATLEEATQVARSLGAKCTVSIGGGSTTGLGKALAVREGLDNVAIPTTYSASEMTDIWGVTEDGRKSTSRDRAALPTLTLYDPRLTVSLPPSVSAASGLNGLAQAVVNVATDRPNPMIESLALDGIRALAQSLPKVIAEPDNIEARSQALYGTAMAGCAIGLGATSLHHKLCHAFGGALDTPHAETHAILLPHSVAYNAAAAAAGTRRVAEALGVDDAATGIHELTKRIGAPTSLQQIGVAESDLDLVVERVTALSFHNPEPVTLVGIRALLLDAFEGVPPKNARARG